MIRVKEIIVNNEDLDMIDKYINSFVNAFNIELIDIKNIGKIMLDGEEQNMFLIVVDLSRFNQSLYPNTLTDFALGCHYDGAYGWTYKRKYSDNLIEVFGKNFKKINVEDSCITVQG